MPSWSPAYRQYLYVQKVYSLTTLMVSAWRVGACNWASRFEGDTFSTICIPLVERIDVKYLSIVKTSSRVLNSRVAKFSAMYRVKLISSCGYNQLNDAVFFVVYLRRTWVNWEDMSMLKTLTKCCRKSCLVVRFSRTIEYQRCKSAHGVGDNRYPIIQLVNHSLLISTARTLHDTLR